MGFPDLFYIKALPLERVTIVQRHTQMLEWFIALRDDIAERGIISPLLVYHGFKGRPYYIRAGNNRAQAAEIAGVTHVEAISFGDRPDEDLVIERLHSLSEAQALLKDGIIGYNSMNGRDTFKVNSTMMPEHMKYPA